MMGNLRNLDLTKTVLNSIDSFIFVRKSEPFFFLQPVKVHSIFSLRQLGAGKTKMRFILYRLNVTQLVTLLLDSKLVSFLCHFGKFGCGDGGWTPVMKMDGNKVRHLCTFSLSLATRVEKNVLLIINYRF